MNGLVKLKHPDQWMVSFIAKSNSQPTSDEFEMMYLPLHPDDTPFAVQNARVDFEVQTIAQGTSEFDVQDVDVAKVMTWVKR